MLLQRSSHANVIFHIPGSETQKLAVDISKFSWPYFHFGALRNEIKTQQKCPAIRWVRYGTAQVG